MDNVTVYIKRPVFWHQGLFLQPQHFQLTDQHHQFQFTPYREAGIPHFWGVVDMALQESALADRRIAFSSGKFLFPGGEYVEFPGAAIVPPRSFDKEWTEGDKPFPLWLGLRKLSDVTPNVAVVKSLADPPADQVRYLTTADADEVADFFHKGPAAQVKSLTYMVRIFFANEVEGLADYDLIQVANLVRDGEKIVLSPRFVPPCVTAGASTALMDIVREIRDSVAGRARTLEEYKSPGQAGKSDLDPSTMISLLALSTLNRYAPLLFHMTESGVVHPWNLYGLLRQMIGELSTFSARFTMLGETIDGNRLIPPYDHEALGDIFWAVRTLAEQALNEITVGPDQLVILNLDEPDHYSAELPEGFYNPRYRYYLSLRSDIDQDRLLQQAEGGAKMAAITALPDLISRSLSGVELIPMAAPPQGVPRREQALYFRIEPASEHWEAVAREQKVGFYLDNAPSDLKVEIIVRKR